MSDDIPGANRPVTPSAFPAAPPDDAVPPPAGPQDETPRAEGPGGRDEAAAPRNDAKSTSPLPEEPDGSPSGEPPGGPDERQARQRPASAAGGSDTGPSRERESAKDRDAGEEKPAHGSGQGPSAGRAGEEPGTAERRAGASFAGDGPAREQAVEEDPEPTPDPLVDLEQRRKEARADNLAPFGRPGSPLGRTHPFIFGFTGALGVICAWLLFEAVTSARGVIVLIVVSMFLAVGLNPAVERLQRARLPRSGAVAVVFLGLVLAFVGAGFAVIPPLTEQITNFINQLPSYIEQLGQNERIRELDREYQVLQKAQEAVTNPDFGQSAIDGVLGVGRALAGGVFNTLTVLILTLYFLGSLPTIKTFFYRLVPRSRRARVALLGDEILARIGGYVAGTLTVASIAGTTAYIFLSIMQVPFALPLALFVGITALIPLVGATIGAALACTVAFFDGMFTGIACVIFFVVYQQVENYIIHPRVMKRAVDVQPAVTIIAALVGGTLLGIVGALLAIPTAAALALIIREVVLPRQETL